MKIFKNLKSLLAMLFMLVAFFVSSCKSEVTDSDNVAPATLSNINVSNLIGGVKISYDEVFDKNIMLVTAEYETEDGGKEIKRFDISKYSTGFTLTGLLPSTNLLTIYTLNHAGLASESVIIDIAPIISPSFAYIKDVLASINFLNIANGIVFNYLNPEKKQIEFIVEAKNDIGEWEEFSREDTNDETGYFVYQDFTNFEVRIFVALENEYTNYKVFAVSPLVEEVLSKNEWTKVQYDNDNWRGQYVGPAYDMEGLWDGILGSVNTTRFENQIKPLPHSFTIDLGSNQSLALSKIKIYHFANSIGNTYGQYNPKTIEIYGSNNPGETGEWENWTKLVTCVSQMPSGGSTPVTSDLTYLRGGETYSFPVFTPAYRYLRFKVLDTWTKKEGEATFIRLSEITLYGVQQ